MTRRDDLDTPAVKLDGHLPEEVKEERMQELMQHRQKNAFEYGDSLVGFELDVAIDEAIEEGVGIGRSSADAPEIDGTVLVTGEEVSVGEFVPVEIVERDGYDLVGTFSREAESDDVAENTIRTEV